MHDPVEHEANQHLYLESILAHVERYEEKSSDDVSSIVDVSEVEIAKATGMSFRLVSRISDELKDLGLITFEAGGEKGRACFLTPGGRTFTEKHRYEKTLKAKWRSCKKWAVAKTTELAQVGAGKLLGWIGAFVLSGLGILRVEAIARAIRILLGH
jgi:hypothetical protein